MGTLQLSFYPLVIGLTYFLPLDVAFSLWFFYLFGKFQNVAATAMGYHDAGASQALARMPYVGEQSAGAFIGVAVFALYGHAQAVQSGLSQRLPQIGNAGKYDDANEPMPYGVALLGGLVGFAGSGRIWHGHWYELVGSHRLFLFYYLYVITFTRIRAEAGLPWGFGPDMNVHDLHEVGHRYARNQSAKPGRAEHAALARPGFPHAGDAEPVGRDEDRRIVAHEPAACGAGDHAGNGHRRVLLLGCRPDLLLPERRGDRQGERLAHRHGQCALADH